MSARRILLGGRADLSSRSRVFLGPEGVEVEDHAGFTSVRRRMILFDEIQLITIDRRRNRLGILVAAALTLLMVAVAMMSARSSSPDPTSLPAYLSAMAFVASPGIIYILLKLVFGVDVITVFGKRSTAQLTFAYRKQRAREVYDELCNAVRSSTPTDLHQVSTTAASTASPAAIVATPNT